jgi:hypothetical protein
MWNSAIDIRTERQRLIGKAIPANSSKATRQTGKTPPDTVKKPFSCGWDEGDKKPLSVNRDGLGRGQKGANARICPPPENMGNV